MQKNNKEFLIRTYQSEDMSLTLDMTLRHKAYGTLTFNTGSEKVQIQLKGIHISQSEIAEVSLFGEVQSAYKFFKEVIAISGNVNNESLTINWLTIGNSESQALSSGQITLYENIDLMTKSQLDSNTNSIKEFKKLLYTIFQD